MWWYHGDWSWGAWLVMTLGMVVFWALVFWVILTIMRSGAQTASPLERTPEQILAERLARGEIDEDEYHRRLDTLGSSSPASRFGSGSVP